jgi:hypothetical protein
MELYTRGGRNIMELPREINDKMGIPFALEI